MLSLSSFFCNGGREHATCPNPVPNPHSVLSWPRRSGRGALATPSFPVARALAAFVRFIFAKKARAAMESFMSGAMVVQAGLLSVLLAVWITWLGLRGMFWLMPGMSRGSVSQAAGPVRVTADRQ